MAIDKHLITTVLDSIRALENIVPESVYYEIHETLDEQEMLVTRVNLKTLLDAIELDELRYEIECIMLPQMPNYENAHSWMVHFFYNNEQVDSIMGGLRGWVI